MSNYDFFGKSVASLGDLDGDGVNELAVGASGDDTGGMSSYSELGAVHVLFLEAIDVTPPFVTVDILDLSLNDVDNNSGVTFEFSEDVSGFDESDLTVSGGSLSNFMAVDEDSFTATFTATDDVETTGVVSVGTGYTDAAGNMGTAGSDTVAIDTLNPTVTVNIVDASLNDSNTSSNVTFEFSEDVNGFDESDVMVSGGNLSNFTIVERYFR